MVTKQERSFAQGQSFLELGQLKNAQEKFKELCDQNYGAGCSALGTLLESQKDGQSFDYYQKGCQLRDGLGCYGLAAYYNRKRQSKEFKENLISSCQYGFAHACDMINKIRTQKID